MFPNRELDLGTDAAPDQRAIEDRSELALRLLADGSLFVERLVIADNGPGMPPRARENLFVAFEGSARAGGTGLGLAIVRELVEANGGRVELLDTEQGTAFAIDLPSGAAGGG